MIEEIWKPIEGFTGYDVSNMGRIRTYRIQGRFGGTVSELPVKIKKLHISPNGYPSTQLTRNKKATSYNVHTLVAKAFLGTRPDGMETCHNDGDKQNNRADNLRYDTPSNNSLDTSKHLGKRKRNGRKKAEEIFYIVSGTLWRPAII